MKKKNFLIKILGIVAVFVIACFVSGCSAQKDKNIVSIEVVQSTVPQQIVVGGFNDAKIQAKLTYDDNTFETIFITTDLMSEAYKTQLNTPGTYEIEILFRGASTRLVVNIVAIQEQYTVKFYNGRNDIVSIQVVKEGEDATVPEESKYLMSGYDFIGWDRTFTNVTEDINVYGVYVKVSEADDSDYARVLYNCVNNMTNSILNVDEVYSNIRYESTIHYSNGAYNKLVRRRVEDNATMYYEKFEKAVASDNVTYTRSYFDAEGEITSSIEDYYFNQFDVYSKIKGILTSATDLEYTKEVTPSREMHTVVAYVPNTGDGGYDAIKYLIRFDATQILYIDVFNVTNDEETLAEIIYYETEPEKYDMVVYYPTDIDVLQVADNLFKKDVIVDISETIDGETFSKTIYNDASNRAAEVDNGGVLTYIWDTDEATYYTEEEFTSTNIPEVYKTVDSKDRYGKQIYYLIKDFGEVDDITMDAFSIIYIYEVEETSTSPAYTVEVYIESGTIQFITRRTGNTHDLSINVYHYFDNEVIIPQELIDAQDGAIQQ